MYTAKLHKMFIYVQQCLGLRLIVDEKGLEGKQLQQVITFFIIIELFIINYVP